MVNYIQLQTEKTTEPKKGQADAKTEEMENRSIWPVCEKAVQ
jgi:hypothetical protein